MSALLRRPAALGLLVAGGLLSACSGEAGRAKLAGEAMIAVWRAPDPDLPVPSDRVAVYRCEGLSPKMERAVLDTSSCTFAIRGSYSKADVRRLCSEAVISTDLAMHPWRDIKSAPQTSEVRACRQDLGSLPAQFERADEYQRKLMRYALEGGEVPAVFLRDPPPGYPYGR